MIMVQDFSVLAGRAIAPFVPQAGGRQGRRAVACREIPRLLAVRRVLPLVVARHRDQTSRALERVAKERLCFDRLGARVERRRLQFLDRFRPPPRHQAPAHAHEVALAVLLGHHVDWIRGADVVARREIVRRPIERELVQRHDLSPGHLDGEAAAHHEARWGRGEGLRVASTL